MQCRHLFARLATKDSFLVERHNNSKQRDEPQTKYNTCSVTYTIFMNSAFYAMNNAFTTLDAHRSFACAVLQTQSSAFGSQQNQYEQKTASLSPEEVMDCRLSPQTFNDAIRRATSIYQAAMDGSEVMDLDALPLSTQDEADEFAATFAACLPEPVMVEIVEEVTEKDKEESKQQQQQQQKKSKQKNNKKKKDKEEKKIKQKEDIEATLQQYINGMQQRLLSSHVMGEMLPYQKGIQQLFISYMTDDMLTGQPPSWSSICQSQLQLKPFDVDTCLCALRVTPDLVPHRAFQALMLALSPVSGCLLFSQFIELLFRCSTISPLAQEQNTHDANDANDADSVASLFLHAGMRPDVPSQGRATLAARRREDAVRANGGKTLLNTSRSSPRSGLTVLSSPLSSPQYEGKYDDQSHQQSNDPLDQYGGPPQEEEADDQREEQDIRTLLDQLELNLRHQEDNMRQVPSMGFPAANEISQRNIEAVAAPHVWHPMPCVLREVCRAPDGPLMVENLMEAALAYHNSSQYDLAINAYISARSAWLNAIAVEMGGGKIEEGEEGEEEGEDELTEEEQEEKKLQRLERMDIPARASIFILCGIGSVHESAGNDEMALTCYLDAHRIALRRLSHDDADMAIAYSHLGSVCFHLGRFTTASRCYRVAVSIREHLLGDDHPDCAASHSSLGASLCMLGPHAMVEAMYHLKFAAKKLKEKLGPVHPRTVVASRNAERAKRRPSQVVQSLQRDSNGKRPSRFVSGTRPLTLGMRDDLGSFKPGGVLPGVTGKKGKGKKKKGGKKKGKKKK